MMKPNTRFLPRRPRGRQPATVSRENLQSAMQSFLAHGGAIQQLPQQIVEVAPRVSARWDTMFESTRGS